MRPDRVSNLGPLTYESGALPTGPCSLACIFIFKMKIIEFANGADPDEVAHYEPPHLDIQCLSSSL